MTLRIVATGGTFDKHYDEIAGKLAFSQSHLPAILIRARITLPVTIEVVALLDSLDLQKQDRARVIAACQAAPETAIVVIHGTDTMHDTALALGAAFANGPSEKTIVMTGAMIPYEVDNSDALFNLGFAVAAAQTAPRGVHVAMNGQLFSWNNVRKNRAAGVFEQDTRDMSVAHTKNPV